MLNDVDNTGVKLTKQEVREAVISLQSEGKKVPGIGAIRTYIGHGSQGRIKLLRDEVLKELEQGIAMDERNPFSQLSVSLWEQMQDQIKDFKAEIKAEADATIAEYIDKAQAERNEKEKLVNENEVLESKLLARDEEIENINQRLLDTNNELIKLNAMVVEKTESLTLYKQQFQEYKKMTVEYNQTLTLDKSVHSKELKEYKSQIDVLSKTLAEREQAYQTSLFEIEQVENNRWQGLTDWMSDVIGRLDSSVDRNKEQLVALETTKAVIETMGVSQSDQYTDLNKTLLKLNRGVMENVLLLPEIKQQGDIGDDINLILTELKSFKQIIGKK